ncbi:PAC2 family protein [Candidatus Poriferisocius sp.]|uniref:PAC2 family protein n=1 Tax=Candidatus Poriferisocius sp. TaxID=3101276 RepID=UPI003B52E1E0
MLNVEWLEEIPLREPAAVLAFEGWNDASDAASRVLHYLMDKHTSTLIARLDLEDYLNYHESRPLVMLEGGERSIHWPTVGVFAVPLPTHTSDLVLVMGEEPHLRWRRFCLDIVEIFRRLDVGRAVSLGAFIGEIPHTLPTPVFGSSTDPDFAVRFGLHASTYEGPTGITGAITNVLADEGIDAAGLWAGIPHYLAANPSPTGTRALLYALGDVIGFRFDVTDLDAEVTDYEDKVQAAIAESSELVGYVRGLEEESQHRAISLSRSSRLVEEIERFLRNPG